MSRLYSHPREYRKIFPDPPILAFFDFLAFFVFRFSLLFLALFLPVPRILGVPRREKPLLFLGKNPCFFQKSKGWRVRAPGELFMYWSQGEKPPKIRKKKFPGTKFLGTFGPPPTEKTEKIGKIKGTLVRKVPGNLRSQEFVFFFLGQFLCPLIGFVPGCKSGRSPAQTMVRQAQTRDHRQSEAETERGSAASDSTSCASFGVPS